MAGEVSLFTSLVRLCRIKRWCPSERVNHMRFAHASALAVDALEGSCSHIDVVVVIGIIGIL